MPPNWIMQSVSLSEAFWQSLEQKSLATIFLNFPFFLRIYSINLFVSSFVWDLIFAFALYNRLSTVPWILHVTQALQILSNPITTPLGLI